MNKCDRKIFTTELYENITFNVVVEKSRSKCNDTTQDK